jgi:hypothetical protein
MVRLLVLCLIVPLAAAGSGFGALNGLAVQNLVGSAVVGGLMLILASRLKHWATAISAVALVCLVLALTIPAVKTLPASDEETLTLLLRMIGTASAFVLGGAIVYVLDEQSRG